MRLEMDDMDGGSSWTDRKKRMVKAWLELRNNELFQRFVEECLIEAESYRREAGRANTDRDANRLFGKAEAYEDVVNFPRLLADKLIAQYAHNEMIERIESGETNKDVAEVPGQERDGDADSPPRVYERRRFAATVPHVRSGSE